METMTINIDNLISEVVKMISENNHEIGDIEPIKNAVTYENDGWYIDICYECIGKFDNDPGDHWRPSCYECYEASGKVIEIMAIHTDEETGEETELSGEDCEKLQKALDYELSELV